jgi:hypothetical protein
VRAEHSTTVPLNLDVMFRLVRLSIVAGSSSIALHIEHEREGGWNNYKEREVLKRIYHARAHPPTSLDITLVLLSQTTTSKHTPPHTTDLHRSPILT